MAISIYPAYDPPVPEAQLRSDGKLLAAHLEDLDRLAEAAGVAPFTSFMDRRVPGEDVFDIDEFMASWDEWFDAAAGARAVEGMLAAARGPSSPVRLSGDAAYLPDQLEDLLRCLRLAEQRGARFRIEVGM